MPAIRLRPCAPLDTVDTAHVLSIADFAIYPWACRFEWQEINLEEFPNVKAWMERMSHIEFVQRGMAVP